MTTRTKRILLCVTLIDLAFLVYLLYTVWTEYDTFLLTQTILHTPTELDREMLEALGTGSEEVPYCSMMVVGLLAEIASLGGSYYILFGDQRRPVLPISRRAAVVLAVGAILVYVCYTSLIRALFAQTYCRAWMQLADDLLLPLIFAALSLYGLYRLRKEKA